MYIYEPKKYILSAIIYIGDFFHVEKNEVFVELREPSVRSQILLERIQKAETTEHGIAAMREFIAENLTDHSIYKDAKSKMTTPEVVDVIFEKTELVSYVMEEYRKNVFSQRTGGRKSSDTVVSS